MIISCVCVHNVSSLMFQQGWLITSCVSCLCHDREAHPSSPCHPRQVEVEECRWTSPSNQNDWFPRTGTRCPRGISAADVELKTGRSLSLVPWWGGSCRWSASGRTWPPPTAAQPSPEPGTTCPVRGGDSEVDECQDYYRPSSHDWCLAANSHDIVSHRRGSCDVLIKSNREKKTSRWSPRRSSWASFRANCDVWTLSEGAPVSKGLTAARWIPATQELEKAAKTNTRKSPEKMCGMSQCLKDIPRSPDWLFTLGAQGLLNSKGTSRKSRRCSVNGLTM